jgi:hypothetical protein
MRKSTTTLANRAPASQTSEKRPALTPILAEPSPNGQPVSEAAIRLCAYLKWEAAGKPSGDAVPFWLEAERELGNGKKVDAAIGT